MNDYKAKKIVFYSCVRGVGSSTIAYQLSRLLRLPLYQENEYDLVRHLKKVLDIKKYTVKYLRETNEEDLKEGGVFDLEVLNEKYLKNATDIIVLTNNSHLDILKAIASLKQLEKYNLVRKNIHVVFNRLQNGLNREKGYTDVSRNYIKANTKIKNLKFSYIRNNLLYYRGIKEGNFFMNSLINKEAIIGDFFRNNKIKNYNSEDKKIFNLSKNDLFNEYYPSILEVEYPIHLEQLFLNRYERKDFNFTNVEEYTEIFEALEEIDYKYDVQSTFEEYSRKIADKLYKTKYVNDSKVVIKDMYMLLYNIGVFSENDNLYKKHIKRKELKTKAVNEKK